MWDTLKCLSILVGTIAAQACSESKVVQTDQGLLRGFRDAERHFFTFMSVPYATAPPGKDRFKAPLPAPVWMQTFDAVETGKVCPQYLPLPKIQEDCLVANIFVPDTNATNLPVMVYVHGGAYVITSGDYFRYTKLVESKKVIVVTFNYRLGLHGFLCLGTKDVPGNAGMKDQVALLRWVQRNIASFGGNPNDVTVVGCSAGGGAIDLLTLSPMAIGLFNKAIIEGGSCFGVTGVQLDPMKNAKLYAKSLNFTNVDDITALEEFYKTASYELLTSQHEEIIHRDNATSLFGPCIEKDTGTGEEMFLSEIPWHILEQGKYPKLPLLYGYSEMESLESIDHFEHYHEIMNNNFSNFLPGDLQFNSIEEKEEVAKMVKMFYFGDKRVSEETVLNYIDYFSDILFVYPMLRSLSMRQKFGSETLYLFEYSFADENTKYIPYTNVRSAGHCSYLNAITDEDYTNKTEEYVAIKKTLREIWLNFIKTGNPVPEGSLLPAWPHVGENWSPCMAIKNVTPELKKTLSLHKRAKFWDYIYDEHHRIPIPPTNVATSHKFFSIYVLFLLVYFIV